MKERTINEALYYLRIEGGIGQEKLSRGLCTKGAYSKYESGERRIDRLLLSALIQRLGKSSDKLPAVFTPEEYHYFVWKSQVLEAAEKKQMDMVLCLLEEPEAESIVIHAALQQQFVCQMRAYVAWERDADLERGIALLKRAMNLTMPGIKNETLAQYRISMEEMQILLELARLQIAGKREQEAAELLLEITAYVKHQYRDYEAKVKVYPKAVRMLYPLLLQQQREMEGALLCKEEIEMLLWQGVLYDLKELLEGYLACSAGFAKEEPQRIRFSRQLWALREVYEEFGAEQYLSGECRMYYENQEIYLVDEMIQRSRLEKGMSQEALSEEICSPENLSRIERGKGAPSTRNFRALMDKLDTGLDYYNAKLDTTDFLLLERMKELDRAISLRKWEEAQRLLDYIKSRVDLTLPLNQKTLQASENCMLFYAEKLSKEDFLRECEQALGCEGEKWKEERFWKQFFTEYKVNLLVHIAIVYHQMKENDKSIFILEHLLAELEKSKVRLSDRYASSMTVIGNLSSYYEDAGMFDECKEMCELGLKVCFESGRGVRLAMFLGNKAEAMNDEQQSFTEKSKDYLQKAYYLSDLMSDHTATAYTDQYYRARYDLDITWY